MIVADRKVYVGIGETVDGVPGDIEIMGCGTTLLALADMLDGPVSLIDARLPGLVRWQDIEISFSTGAETSSFGLRDGRFIAVVCPAHLGVWAEQVRAGARHHTRFAVPGVDARSVAISCRAYEYDVYELWHAQEFWPDSEDVALLLGLYSTLETAHAAFERASALPRFRRTSKGGLMVTGCRMDADGWTSGYATVMPGET